MSQIKKEFFWDLTFDAQGMTMLAKHYIKYTKKQKYIRYYYAHPNLTVKLTDYNQTF